MSTSDPSDDRDVLFRRVLVMMARRTPAGVRGAFLRNVVAVAIGSIVAFGLAGALTGGAIASTSVESARQVTADATARFAALDVVHRNDGKVVGNAILKSSTKTLTLDPHAPAGANYYVLGIDCLNAGRFRVELGHLSSGYYDCTAAEANSKEPVGNGFGGSLSNEKSTHLKISAEANARFTIWFAWVKIPTLKSSAQERTQIAEGPITRAGLVTALDRYTACMADLGYDVGPMSGAITPGFPLAPQTAVTSGANRRCELTEENQVGEIWYSEIRKGTVATASVTACLKQNHLAPAASAADRAAQLIAADPNWQSNCNYVD
jgi:hypothetical protein